MNTTVKGSDHQLFNMSISVLETMCIQFYRSCISMSTVEFVLDPVTDPDLHGGQEGSAESDAGRPGDHQQGVEHHQPQGRDLHAAV